MQNDGLPVMAPRSRSELLAARRAKRYPLARWESTLRPGPCVIRYRDRVLADANEALRHGGALPSVAPSPQKQRPRRWPLPEQNPPQLRAK